MPKGSKKRAAAKKKALGQENSVNAGDNQERKKNPGNSSEHEASIINKEQGVAEKLDPVTSVESDSLPEASNANETVQQSAGSTKCNDVNPETTSSNQEVIVVESSVSSDVTSNAADQVSLDMYRVANDVLVGKLKSAEQVHRFKTSVIEELKAAENMVAFLQKVLNDLNSLPTNID